MSAQVSTTTLLERSHRSVFHERRMRIGRNRVTHHVAWQTGADGVSRPVPACHTGWWGVGSSGELRPTRWPATCRRCRRISGEEDLSDQLQLELFRIDCTRAHP